MAAKIKENIKAPRHWPLWGESTGDRWIPHTKGQQRGKCSHYMTSSSWSAETPSPSLSSSVHILSHRLYACNAQVTCITPFGGNMRHEVALELHESDSLQIRIRNLWQRWPSYNQRRDHIGKSMPDVYLIQLPWPSGKSQACHDEGPVFPLGTLQGVLFTVAAHHTTLAWQWARDWGALFPYHLVMGGHLRLGISSGGFHPKQVTGHTAMVSSRRKSLPNSKFTQMKLN